MRKTKVDIEIVPVEVAKKVLERQKLLARRSGKSIARVEKSGKSE
jgi:hypothetical protein